MKKIAVFVRKNDQKDTKTAPDLDLSVIGWIKLHLQEEKLGLKIPKHNKQLNLYTKDDQHGQEIRSQPICSWNMGSLKTFGENSV